MGIIEARDGTKLHVKDTGSGEPVVLIHGWPLTGDMWEYQTLALLEAGFRVITYDRRGFGQSGHPATGYDYDTFTDDLEAVVDACGLDRVNLVGFSMGGGEVAHYVGRHGSAKVARAALIGSIVPFLPQTDDNPDGAPQSALEDMKRQIREDRFAFLQGFAPSFYGNGFISRPVSQGVLDWTFILAIMASPLATIACVDSWSADFRPDLAGFAGVPTLIVHGTADKTVPIDATARQAARFIPHARLVEYDGEAHGLFASAPDRLNQDLLSFLAS